MKRVEIFVTRCVEQGYITAEKAPWLQYALEKKITVMIAMIPLLLIGVFISSFTETIAFYISFFIIRRYSNGVHSTSFIKCFFVSVISEIIFLGVLTEFLTPVSCMILLPVSGVLIWCLAPYSHPNMMLSSEEVIACAVGAKKSTLQISVAISILYFFGCEDLADGALLGYVMASAMLLIAYIPIGGKQNEN